MRCKVNNNYNDAFYATSERLFFSLLPVFKLSHVFFYSSHIREKPAFLRAFPINSNQKIVVLYFVVCVGLYFYNNILFISL